MSNINHFKLVSGDEIVAVSIKHGDAYLVRNPLKFYFFTNEFGSFSSLSPWYIDNPFMVMEIAEKDVVGVPVPASDVVLRTYVTKIQSLIDARAQEGFDIFKEIITHKGTNSKH